MSKLVLIQVNEACVEGAIRAGMKFNFMVVSISPASCEIAELSSMKTSSSWMECIYHKMGRLRLPGIAYCWLVGSRYEWSQKQ